MEESTETLTRVIYEAALEPALWDSMLGRVARSIHATTALFLSGDLAAERFDFITEYGSEPWIFPRMMERHRLNPLLVAELQHGLETTHTTEVLVPMSALARTEFYADILNPARIQHGIAFYQTAGCNGISGRIVGLNAFRPLRANAFTTEECARLEALRPVLLRAADARVSFARVEMQKATALAALDLISSAMILVDDTGQAFFVNARAEAILAKSDGLSIASGSLSAATPELTSQLRSCIFAAVQAGLGKGRGAGASILLQRPSGAPPLAVSITPLLMHGLFVGCRRAAAAVSIAEPVRGKVQHLGAFSEAFHLTPTEARVASAVADGKGVPAIAVALGLSVNTVRTHLYRVLDKTGTRRQSELTALIHRFDAQQPRRVRR
jgi:DNA-binding CsgD family transcriptional regulator